MMPYPSDHQLTVEELRELVGDDGVTETFADARYATWIARYPDDWRMAAVAAANSLIKVWARKPNRISSDGDSIGWTDKRISVLEADRDAWLADINADDVGGIVTVTADYLTAPAYGGAEWP